jgi:hypothetical protein
MLVNGLNFVRLDTPNGIIGIGGHVQSPSGAGGYFGKDTWAVGWTRLSSTTIGCYFQYNKVANEGTNDLIVEWCT